MEDVTSVAALWWAVIFSGLYHGINPGMGWPLAVSAALMEQKARALPRALAMLALGHFLAMIVILLPFSLMLVLVEYETQIRIGAGVIVIAMGVYLLINRRHPRFLARVHPARLALWSFLAAMAHGAGLMLVPIFLGICAIGVDEVDHLAAEKLMGNNVGTAFIVAALHTFAMTVAGGVIAVIIYLWLGLKFLSKTWFNLDIIWALSLIVVGAFGIYTAYSGH
ncbi:hypothetical protein C8N43_0977 [Litoreibacter ponti]|uniref:Uncharacterized protein n=1 Tax=Litoreibacter ponti TaxID=1510457 RepID=A0A2T6BJW1_9RHOB|nr:hypothetical protein [Litoreibacter ponti]PTX56322.1 hypothetical protein C8N43_0977 [Litoreibacter ponti]